MMTAEEEATTSEVRKYDFDADFQRLVVALMLRDITFARRTSGLIQPEYFDSPVMAFFADVANDYFESYRATPSTAVLTDVVAKRLADNPRLKLESGEEIANTLFDLMHTALADTDYVAERIVPFAQYQAISDSIFSAVETMEQAMQDGDSSKFQSIRGKIEKATQVGINDALNDVDAFAEIDVRTRTRAEKKAGKLPPSGITTGVAKLDAALYHGGWGKSEFTVIMAPPKGGKCLKSETLIANEDGFVPIGSLVEPEQAVDTFEPLEGTVVGRYGSEPMTHVYNAGMCKTIKVTTCKGRVIQGTHEHPMLVMDTDGELVWRRLDELTEGDQLVSRRGDQHYGNHTDISDAASLSFSSHEFKDVTLPKAMTPELAEWMGLITAEAWLDEKSGAIKFSKVDSGCQQHYRSLVKSLFNVEVNISTNCVGFQRRAVMRYCESLDLKFVRSASKCIPSSVLKAPRECVVAYLNALLGMDGYVSTNATGTKVAFELCMASEELIAQVQMLLLNEGITSRVVPKRAKASNGSGTWRTYWRLSVSGFANITRLRDQIGLHDPVKQAKLDALVESDNKTSRDRLPHCAALVERLLGYLDGSRANGSLRKNAKSVANGDRPLNYTLARRIADAIPVDNEDTRYLRHLIDTNYQYESVEIIVDGGEHHCVDVTVPGTHSFIANGFISHNSASLAEFAKIAALNGYNALIVTLEVSAEIYLDRLDANISSTPMAELIELHDKVEMAVSSAGVKAGMLKVIEFPNGTLSPSALARLISRYKNDGIYFDMVAVDYADLMVADNPVQSEITNSKSIYIGLRAIAQIERLAMLSATQLNREGSRKDTAVATDVAEDFNRIRIPDLVLAISRTDAEKENNMARFHTVASRNQSEGISLTIEQDLERMQFIKRVVDFSSSAGASRAKIATATPGLGGI